jgi:imidazolonepropionase-like amidohydrolase
MRAISRIIILTVTFLFATGALLATTPAISAENKPLPQTLFTNVNVFDGKADELAMGMSVLVEGKLIKEIAKGGIKTNRLATVINGGGRTLMPGIIEGHGHVGLPFHVGRVLGDEDWQYIGAKTTVTAKFFLEHGWTTVRDVGGPVAGIKKAIDEGAVPGPRIYPSGMFISQTSGHGDFRRFADLHPNQLAELPFFNRYFGHIADGVPEVLRAAREELRKGSVHLKLMAGGGIASQYDPLHTAQFTLDEMRAAVDAASDWGTYVMVHAYTDKAVSRAIEAGVKVIEHGQLMTEETAKAMASKGVWLSTQVAFVATPPTEEAIKVFGQTSYLKWKSVNEGLKTSIEFAKKYKIKFAFGTDLWGDELPRLTTEFAARKAYFSDAEILRQATSVNGELLKLTGKLNPYPDGPLGVIAEGAYADILLVEGNPLENIELLTDPEQNIPVIMKDGKVYKNTLE